MPPISVVITTHGRPHLLPRAVQSAHQAGQNVEVIVVDDASTDSTQEICRGLPGIRYIRLAHNLGTSGARNVGLLASTGDYISFHDDDDRRLPGSLDRQIQLLEQEPQAGLCYGQVLLGDADCNPTTLVEPKECLAGDIFWELLSWNPIICIAAVFRKECLWRVGLIKPEVKLIDDWDLWVRIAEQYRVVCLEQPVAIWRQATPTSGQGSSNPVRMLVNARQLQRSWLRLPRAQQAPAARRRLARQVLLNRASDWLIWDAAHWVPAKNPRYCRSSLLGALQLNFVRACRPWTLRLLLQTFF